MIQYNKQSLSYSKVEIISFSKRDTEDDGSQIHGIE